MSEGGNRNRNGVLRANPDGDFGAARATPAASPPETAAWLSEGQVAEVLYILGVALGSVHYVLCIPYLSGLLRYSTLCTCLRYCVQYIILYPFSGDELPPSSFLATLLRQEGKAGTDATKVASRRPSSSFLALYFRHSASNLTDNMVQR